MAFDRKHFQAKVYPKLDALEEIWQSVGMEKDQRRDRAEVAVQHVTDLLGDMVEAEELMKQRIEEKVKSHRATLYTLCAELNISQYEPSANLQLIFLEKDLRLKVKSLGDVRTERMTALHELQKADQSLCDVLQMTPFYIPSGTVPSEEQLNSLRGHVAALEKEKEERNIQFHATRSYIVSLMEKLERCPNSSFEKDVLCDEEDSFLLSSQNMKSLKDLHKELEQEQRDVAATAKQLRDDIKTLWDRLQVDTDDREIFCAKYNDDKPSTIKALQEEVERCNELKMANIKQVIDGARRQLHEWWDKCFFTQEQRNVFTPLFSDEYSEDLLAQHDQELCDLKAYYAQSAELFENTARWKVLWESFLEFEKKANDPDRFFNRGCNLLKEEKARKKLMRELPRVEQEVATEIEAWEKQNRRDFLVGGVRFADYIKTQWEQYHAQKENEKKQRLQAKAKETEEEMIYGSKPITPAKRRFAATTPSKTPNKYRKVDTPKTPGSVSRLANKTNHTSVFASPSVVMPRSGSKTQRTLRNHPSGRSKRVLTDKNSNVTASNETLFSQTAVSSGTSCSNVSQASIASIGPYKDFATCLNHKTRSQCRSSVAARPAFF